MDNKNQEPMADMENMRFLHTTAQLNTIQKMQVVHYEQLSAQGWNSTVDMTKMDEHLRTIATHEITLDGTEAYVAYQEFPKTVGEFWALEKDDRYYYSISKSS
jgi:flagellar hook assembly protein FlgD